jgi:hypothetical protein
MELAENYEGDAREEMEMFFYGLIGQTGKLIQLYQKVKSYIMWTYQSFYHNDEMMTSYMQRRGLL